jgi:glycosyltransferase involved in cell wall biosynthesis
MLPASEVKVSLILTVRNESKTIVPLLESVASQARLPDEVVIVDGGSTDDTEKKISDFTASQRGAFPIRLISCPGSNIPQGRNIAIKNCSHQAIACTDAGCQLDTNWMMNLVKPIAEGTADVSIGVSVGIKQDEFHEVESHMVVPTASDYESGMALCTSRSMAYTRGIWQRVGGYPEGSSFAEDTAFFLALRKASAKMAYCPSAVVYWNMRDSLGEVFRQFLSYSKGDGYHHLFPLRYFTRYIALALLLMMFALFWPNPFFWMLLLVALLTGIWLKQIRRVPRLDIKRFWIALKLAIAIESGITIGYAWGLLTRKQQSSGGS